MAGLKELSGRGEQQALLIMRTIKDVRAEHHACTAREVSRLLRMNNTVLVRQLAKMRELGLVEWTDLTGSLHLTLQGAGILARKTKKPGPRTRREDAKTRLSDDDQSRSESPG